MPMPFLAAGKQHQLAVQSSIVLRNLDLFVIQALLCPQDLEKESKRLTSALRLKREQLRRRQAAKEAQAVVRRRNVPVTRRLCDTV